MREIKFRAWDGGQILTVDEIDFDSMYARCRNTTGDTVVADDPLLLQHTGLTDKNGREIYQADRCVMNSYLTAEVRYKENMGAWYVGSRRLTKKLASQIEVIGNKYES